jgi:hypothetical protein
LRQTSACSSQKSSCFALGSGLRAKGFDAGTTSENEGEVTTKAEVEGSARFSLLGRRFRDPGIEYRWRVHRLIGGRGGEAGEAV